MVRTISKFSSTLEKLLKDCGMQSRLHEYRIFAQWGRIVGPAVARHAQPKGIRSGKLSVAVDSSAWMQQLALLKPELIDRLNKEMGGTVVRAIILFLGTFDEPFASPADNALHATTLTQADKEKIDASIRTIGDRETREALRKLLEKEVAFRKQTGNDAGQF